MKKMPLLMALVTVCLLIVNFSQSAFAATTSSIISLPDTTEGIHLALIHESHASIDAENGMIDYVWGAQRPQSGHTIHKEFYFKFDRAGSDPGTHGFPVYYDKAWFLKNHPDWLVYLCDKTTLAYEFGDPNVPLDITNPAVRQFILDTWIKPALDNGYDGISFDNINLDNSLSAGRCGVWTSDANGNSQWKYLYKDAQSIHGAAYTSSIVDWARTMYSAIHSYQTTATVTMNYSPNNGGDMHGTLAANEVLLPYADNMLSEGGFTDGKNSPYTVDRYWQLEAGFARDLVAQGKAQVLVFGFNFSTLTAAQKQWALANYLLVKGNHSYMAISSGADNGALYGHFNVIPEYAMHIGHAVNLMYVAQGVYMRDFSNGKTLVNPSSTQSFTVTVPPATYSDVYGNAINGSVVLAPHSGLVLLTVQSIATVAKAPVTQQNTAGKAPVTQQNTPAPVVYKAPVTVVSTGTQHNVPAKSNGKISKQKTKMISRKKSVHPLLLHTVQGRQSKLKS